MNSTEIAQYFIAEGKTTYTVVCNCRKCLNKKWVKVDILDYAKRIEGFDEKQVKAYNHAILQQLG